MRSRFESFSRPLTWVAIAAAATVTAAPVQAGPLGNLLDTTLKATLIPDQYIITLEPALLDGALTGLGLKDTVRSLLAGVGAGEPLAVYEHALTGFAARLTPLQAELLSLLPVVAAVEPDQVVTLGATQLNPPYNLDRTDQRNRPLNQRFDYPDSPGAGVNVYIIDTGINANHVDFAGRVKGGRNFAPSGGGLFGGGTTNPNDLTDCNGHGTHVSGTALGTTYGIAKAANLYTVRVFGCGNSSSNSVILAGIDWTAANAQLPAVANMSLGGGASTATDTAVRNLVNAGVVAVVAAGNDNGNACSYSPAREPLAITVGSTTSSDARSSFSNFGSCVDIFAPGSSIVSASHSNNTGTATLSGTSMASPLVAGVAAVYLGQNPSADPAAVTAALIEASTKNVVTSAGSGSPNRLAYLDPDSGSGQPIDQPPVARFTVACTELTCSFDAATSSDDQGIAAYSWNFGDGSGGNGAQLSHTYASGGSYSVSLTVTDTVGQTDDSSQTLTVTGPSVDPCTNCTRYTGSLSSGGSVLVPGSSGFSSGGQIKGYLRGPAGADWVVTLQRRSGFLFTRWSTVATADGPGASEDLVYNSTSGVYRFQVRSKSGAGSFEFFLESN